MVPDEHVARPGRGQPLVAGAHHERLARRARPPPWPDPSAAPPRRDRGPAGAPRAIRSSPGGEPARTAYSPSWGVSTVGAVRSRTHPSCSCTANSPSPSSSTGSAASRDEAANAFHRGLGPAQARADDEGVEPVELVEDDGSEALLVDGRADRLGGLHRIGVHAGRRQTHHAGTGPLGRPRREVGGAEHARRARHDPHRGPPLVGVDGPRRQPPRGVGHLHEVRRRRSRQADVGHLHLAGQLPARGEQEARLQRRERHGAVGRGAPAPRPRRSDRRHHSGCRPPARRPRRRRAAPRSRGSRCRRRRRSRDRTRGPRGGRRRRRGRPPSCPRPAAARPRRARRCRCCPCPPPRRPGGRRCPRASGGRRGPRQLRPAR